MRDCPHSNFTEERSGSQEPESAQEELEEGQELASLGKGTGLQPAVCSTGSWAPARPSAPSPPPQGEDEPRHLGQLLGAGTARLRAQLTYQIPSAQGWSVNEGDEEIFKAASGRGSSGLFTRTWHAGVTGPPWSASEVSSGQIKGRVLPAGEDSMELITPRCGLGWK